MHQPAERRKCAARAPRADSTTTSTPCYTDPVANLTLSIDDDLLKRARIRALENGTSVNAVVREFLGDFVGTDRSRDAIRDFLALANASNSGQASSSRAWARDDLYEERLERG